MQSVKKFLMDVCQGDEVTFRFLPNPSEITVDLTENMWMAPLSRAGKNVYFIPNCTSGSRLPKGAFTKDSDITQINALFVDHDGGGGEEVWNKAIVAGAHYVIETSPGNFHAYWLVSNVPSVDCFEVLTRRLWKKLELMELDRTIINPSRIMRAPGFANLKHNFISRIVYSSGLPRYNLANDKELLELFGADGRNVLFLSLSGYNGGVEVAERLNAGLDNGGLSDREMSTIKRQSEKYMSARSPIQKSAIDRLVYCISNDSFYDSTDIHMGALSYNNIKMMYGITKPWEKVNSGEMRVVKRVRFLPDMSEDYKDELNLYKDMRVPVDSGADYSWFLKIIDANFGGDPVSIKIMLQFMALTCCYPEKKLEWGVLVVGKKEGTGKSAIYNIMRGILGGDQYCRNISGEQLLHQFNGFLDGKVLVYIDEVLHEGRHDIVNKIKEWFTASKINIRKMYRDSYLQDNIANIYLTSNYERPLCLKGDSRRLAVLQVPESARPPIPYDEYIRLLNDRRALGGVLYYLYNHVSLEGLDLTRAPDTEAKRDLIIGSKPNWEYILDTYIQNIESDDKTYIFPKLAFIGENEKMPKYTTLNSYLRHEYGYIPAPVGARPLTIGGSDNYKMYAKKGASFDRVLAYRELKKQMQDFFFSPSPSSTY